MASPHLDCAPGVITAVAAVELQWRVADVRSGRRVCYQRRQPNSQRASLHQRAASMAHSAPQYLAGNLALRAWQMHGSVLATTLHRQILHCIALDPSSISGQACYQAGDKQQMHSRCFVLGWWVQLCAPGQQPPHVVGNPECQAACRRRCCRS